jgi:hypothetical protein
MSEIAEHNHDIGVIDERVRECRVESLVRVSQPKRVVPCGVAHLLEREVRVRDHPQPQHAHAHSLARRAAIVERPGRAATFARRRQS